jgi:hypothetical protein
VVLEKLTGVKDWTEICREYRLRPQVFSRWWEELLKRAPEIVAGDRSQETHRRVGAHGQALDPRGGQKSLQRPPHAIFGSREDPDSILTSRLNGEGR